LERALMHGAAARRRGEPMLLMTHYPPFTSDGQRTAYVDLISQYQPNVCVYGHLHSPKEWAIAQQGVFEGVEYVLAAADFLNMTPRLIWTQNNDHGVEGN
jgi:hypothetical protein